MIKMSREEAIGRIQDHKRIHSKKEPFTPYLDKAFYMAIEALKEKRPHGEWIYDMFDENYHCSECNRVCDTIYHFCPNCGADMREGDSE